MGVNSNKLSVRQQRSVCASSQCKLFKKINKELTKCLVAIVCIGCFKKSLLTVWVVSLNHPFYGDMFESIASNIITKLTELVTKWGDYII